MNAPLSALDRTLYIEGMNSGYGLKPAAEFLAQQARNRKIILIIPAKPGNSPDGVLIYLRNNPDISIVHAPWWPQNPILVPVGPFPYYAHKYARKAVGIRTFPADRDIYFIYPYTNYPEALFLGNNPGFKKIWSFPKPDPQFSVTIYKKSGSISPQ
ncbi:MAG: hypothetical protein COV66_11935 [Nitrospinae bacterium CG11_big_fil_rev_8_21_14_0_20_45_15]|nr:MAG: hypothetical protein COV66_11935 [Nitrospinae bacterium CG11_big_fil_rev_8_21_14_0_20_45_15]